MKKKHLFLAIVALLAAGALWLARSNWSGHASQKSSVANGSQIPSGEPMPGQMRDRDQPAQLAPPNPTQRFKEFTPEQRVEFARKGHGPGG